VKRQLRSTRPKGSRALLCLGLGDSARIRRNDEGCQGVGVESAVEIRPQFVRNHLAPIVIDLLDRLSKFGICRAQLEREIVERASQNGPGPIKGRRDLLERRAYPFLRAACGPDRLEPMLVDGLRDALLDDVERKDLLRRDRWFANGRWLASWS
jgi:hypothetical protein